MKHTKIAIIGAGAVGSTTAYALMLKNVASQIILVDVNDLRCKGEALDLSDTLPFSDTGMLTVGTLADARTADIIIFAAGMAQKPGQSRQELLDINKNVVISVLQQLQPINPSALLIMVTNPVDIMTYYAQQVSKLPQKQVFGTGTFLDSQRLRCALAERLDIAEESIHAYMLGEHGDSQFAAWSCAYAGGLPIGDFPGMSAQFLAEIEKSVQQKAYDIITCKGATYYGIAACVAALCQIIIFNQKMIVPFSTFHPEFKVCLSVPVVLGECGIEQTINIPLTSANQEKLKKSAEILRTMIS